MPASTVIEHFSKYASEYDSQSVLQDLVAESLFDTLPSCSPKRILDVGCGTGKTTQALLKRFPQAEIIGLDLSPAMIAVAQKQHSHPQITYCLGDAKSFELESPVDLIFSNAAFQWIYEKDLLIQHLKTLLSPNGQLSASIFGPDTFPELRQAFSKYYSKPIQGLSSEFSSKKELLPHFQKHFKKVEVRSETIKTYFDSLNDFIHSMTVTCGKGLKEKYLKPDFLSTVEKIYLLEHQKIVASSDLFYITAKI